MDYIKCSFKNPYKILFMSSVAKGALEYLLVIKVSLAQAWRGHEILKSEVSHLYKLFFQTLYKIIII